MATLPIVNKVKADYRDFRITATRNPNSGTWSYLAKGLGVPVFDGNYDTADDAIAEAACKLDVLYSRGLGVFARRPA